MKGSLQVKVKICCISSKEEANLAIECGATAIGLVGNMPSGPGIISDPLIQELAESIPKEIATFLLTSETSSLKIIELLRRTNTSTVQVVDKLTKGTYEDIQREFPTIDIVQVIHVQNENSITEALRVSKYVDYVLLDSGNPNLKIKVLGGTGQTHNWELSKRIREELDIPVYLAGGLNPENIQDAIRTVQPYGVDLCSGVRTNQKLDPQKLKAFFSSIKGLGNT